MVTIGVDAHKRTHTFVAVDDLGRKLAERTLPATTDGHLDAVEWAERWVERRWAIEDCRHLTRRLESDLLTAGEAVLRVPTRLMAGERRGGRERGKSDPIDALAVARAALREPDLPVAQLEGPARELKLLIDHREDLVRERVRMQSRLRWHLHELFPGLDIPPRALRRQHVLAQLEQRLAGVDGTVARIARELLATIRELTVRVNALEREITGIVRTLAPALLALAGCGALSAAKIVGETAGAARFKSKAAFARWNGTAPIPVWSGSTNFRLNRGGNRQVNAALHRIAVTQCRAVRAVGAGRAYVQARMAAGDSKTEALRLLRRRLSDEVFRRLLADERLQHGDIDAVPDLSAAA
jgi:transposase